MKLFQLLLCGLSALILPTIAIAQNTEKTPVKRDVKRLKQNYYIAGRFSQKTILITGGARGIGKWTAIRAVKEGANVLIMDWLEEIGKNVVDSINTACSKVGGGKAVFVLGNIAEAKDCDKMVEVAVKEFGKIDYAVLNAGVMDGAYSGQAFTFDDEQRKLMPNPVADATDEYWQNVLKTNADGSFYSLRSSLRQMLHQGQGGAIVMVASIAGMTGLAGNPAYVASKHAVNGLMGNAAIDYAPYGIRINSVNMAETQTPMVDRAGEFVQAQIKAGGGFGMGRIKTMSLLKYCDSEKRGSFPWEQASNILYLLSDEASALTGTVMATDGGWTGF